MPSPVTKIHQIRYVFPETHAGQISDLLAVSTEDGRIIFYSTSNKRSTNEQDPNPASPALLCVPLGQLGGKDAGMTVRIKDFDVLVSPAKGTDEQNHSKGHVVTASSDGSIRIWALARTDLKAENQLINGASEHLQPEKTAINGQRKDANGLDGPGTRQCGTLLGTYETGNRITCLKAFTMLKPRASQDTVLDDAASDEFHGIADSDAES